VLIPRQFVRTVGVFVYQCPICLNQMRYDDRYEPICTGPSWTDDHPPAIMTLISVVPRKVVV